MAKRTKRQRTSGDGIDLVLGIAWYRREQWNRLLEISADREKMEDTYEEWEANAEKGLQMAARPGVVFRKVDIDVEELVEWCRSQRRPVDGAARAIFTAEKLKEQSEKNQ